jgi:hypothetical protein
MRNMGPLATLNSLYNRLVFYTFSISQYLLRYFDRGLLEVIFGGTGLGSNLIHYLSFRLEILSTGYFYHVYIFLFFLQFFLVLSY